MSEQERIIDMFYSDDPSIVRLAAILALGMGSEWCLDTFHYITINAQDNKKRRHKFPVIPAHHDLRYTVYTKGGIAISFLSNYVQCDYLYRLCPNKDYHGLVDLDKEEE